MTIIAGNIPISIENIARNNINIINKIVIIAYLNIFVNIKIHIHIISFFL